ncbi:unnamed protein product [Adineta steineri]|uniref:Uncharacterized protein n=1 Tax=Adineta steineri TaxID=433720 RepID=A0A818ZD29_9BILA|nr:unnamed protein product [Adineta steineri]
MQKWTGTYKWDDYCATNRCCCYTGTLVVTQSGSNLVFSSGTQGCANSQASSTFSNPNGYSFSTIGTRGSHIVYTLSSDSNTLSVSNRDYNYCGGNAARTSVGIHVYPSIIWFVVMLTAIWIFA